MNPSDIAAAPPAAPARSSTIVSAPVSAASYAAAAPAAPKPTTSTSHSSVQVSTSAAGRGRTLISPTPRTLSGRFRVQWSLFSRPLDERSTTQRTGRARSSRQHQFRAGERGRVVAFVDGRDEHEPAVLAPHRGAQGLAGEDDAGEANPEGGHLRDVTAEFGVDDGLADHAVGAQPVQDRPRE